jgi:subtilase family protein
LLRLDPPTTGDRRKRSPGFAPSRKFDPADQRDRQPGVIFRRLAQTFEEGRDPLELRADPAGLAPERLLVFELTAEVQDFARAATRVPGLEFIGAEGLESDDFDDNPTLYLMIPDSVALQQLVSLWNRFQAGETLPAGMAPWRNLFAQLRDLRPWGPQDRISDEDLAVLAEERVDVRGMVRLELELVFRPEGAGVERSAVAAIHDVGGQVVTRTRIDGAKYHAFMADVPQGELQRIRARGQQGLVASEAVMHIRPQTAMHITAFENHAGAAATPTTLPQGDPIVAIFDAVPVAGHPRLDGRLSVEDPFGLEPQAVGPRLHGTAMASAVVHGDLAAPTLPALERKVFFLNVMYATRDPNTEERFPDRLPADLFHEAIARMKTGGGASAPSVIVINVSLGDRNKPFTGRMSGWARVIDYLSHTYGVLFVISAGNYLNDLVTTGVTTIQFENLDDDQKARSALRASGNLIAHRRILAPAESVNALTVGALHTDNILPRAPSASIFDVWRDTGLCTISSALGPGYRNAVKPDVLSPGGRHHVRLLPDTNGHRLKPIGKNAAQFGGIVVAAPPIAAVPNPDVTSCTVGTSVAAALLTGVAARAHEALEAAYDDFIEIGGPHRAVLLKALLVHCASWTPAHELIVDVLCQATDHHTHKKNHVRRYLGYGAVDAGVALDCATDRATLWAVGSLQREQAHTFSVPLPEIMSGKAQLHQISTTVAWFAPPRVGTAMYRGVRLRLVEPKESAVAFAVKPTSEQPDTNQAHSGTVIHRRWTGVKAAALGAQDNFELMIQRQPDDMDDAVPYALVTTVAMPGVAEVYAQVRERVAIKPKVAVRP